MNLSTLSYTLEHGALRLLTLPSTIHPAVAQIIAASVLSMWESEAQPVVLTITTMTDEAVEVFVRYDGTTLNTRFYSTERHARTGYECGVWGHQFSVEGWPQQDMIDVCGVQVVIAQEGVR